MIDTIVTIIMSLIGLIVVGFGLFLMRVFVRSLLRFHRGAEIFGRGTAKKSDGFANFIVAYWFNILALLSSVFIIICGFGFIFWPLFGSK